MVKAVHHSTSLVRRFHDKLPAFYGHTDGSGGICRVCAPQECVEAWRALGRPEVGAQFTESVLGGCGHNGHLEARAAPWGMACEVVSETGGLIRG